MIKKLFIRKGNIFVLGALVASLMLSACSKENTDKETATEPSAITEQKEAQKEKTVTPTSSPPKNEQEKSATNNDVEENEQSPNENSKENVSESQDSNFKSSTQGSDENTTTSSEIFYSGKYLLNTDNTSIELSISSYTEVTNNTVGNVIGNKNNGQEEFSGELIKIDTNSYTVTLDNGIKCSLEFSENSVEISSSSDEFTGTFEKIEAYHPS